MRIIAFITDASVRDILDHLGELYIVSPVFSGGKAHDTLSKRSIAPRTHSECDGDASAAFGHDLQRDCAVTVAPEQVHHARIRRRLRAKPWPSVKNQPVEAGGLSQGGRSAWPPSRR